MVVGWLAVMAFTPCMELQRRLHGPGLLPGQIFLIFLCSHTWVVAPVSRVFCKQIAACACLASICSYFDFEVLARSAQAAIKIKPWPVLPCLGGAARHPAGVPVHGRR